MEDLGCINNNDSEVGLIRSFFKEFFKISYHSHSLMLSSSKLKPPRFPKNPAIPSGMKITLRRTGWRKFNHPCKKASNKSKNVQKCWKGNTMAPMTKSSVLKICTQFHYFKYFLGNSSWNFRILEWKKARLEASEKEQKADEFVRHMSRECINSKNEKLIWYDLGDYKDMSKHFQSVFQPYSYL